MSIISEVIESTKAIIQCMGVTLSYIPKRKWTVEYPDEPVTMQPRYRGQHLLHVDERGRAEITRDALLAPLFVLDERGNAAVPGPEDVLLLGVLDRVLLPEHVPEGERETLDGVEGVLTLAGHLHRTRSLRPRREARSRRRPRPDA